MINYLENMKWLDEKENFERWIFNIDRNLNLPTLIIKKVELWLFKIFFLLFFLPTKHIHEKKNHFFHFLPKQTTQENF